MNEISFKLPIFEGPLDLLISLIGKKKIDVCDINIGDILDQYMAYLRYMEEMDLEITSSFLVMASDLLYIKSKMILPQYEAEEEDPRINLVRSLNEYIRHKESAKFLAQSAKVAGEVFIRLPNIPSSDDNSVYEKKHDPCKLLDAYQEVVLKNRRKLPPPISTFSELVSKKIISIGEKVSKLFNLFTKKGRLKVKDIFTPGESRQEIVATFMALLNLMNAKYLLLSENGETLCLTREDEPTELIGMSDEIN